MLDCRIEQCSKTHYFFVTFLSCGVDFIDWRRPSYYLTHSGIETRAHCNPEPKVNWYTWAIHSSDQSAGGWVVRTNCEAWAWIWWLELWSVGTDHDLLFYILRQILIDESIETFWHTCLWKQKFGITVRPKWLTSRGPRCSILFVSRTLFRSCTLYYWGRQSKVLTGLNRITEGGIYSTSFDYLILGLWHHISHHSPIYARLFLMSRIDSRAEFTSRDGCRCGKLPLLTHLYLTPDRTHQWVELFKVRNFWIVQVWGARSIQNHAHNEQGCCRRFRSNRIVDNSPSGQVIVHQSRFMNRNILRCLSIMWK